MWKYLILMMAILALIFSACAPLEQPESVGVQPTEDRMEETDQEKSLLTEDGDSQEVVIHWQRSGGFAGICQQMDIFADGHMVIENCDSNQIIASGKITEQERGVLIDWLSKYGQFTWKFTPPKGSADMFVDEYTFSGIGDQLPTEQSQEQLNQELSTIVQKLLQRPLTE